MSICKLTEKYKDRTKFLVTDNERRNEDNQDYILTSSSLIGLNRHLETVFSLDVFLVDSLNCPNFVRKTVAQEFLSLSNYIACAWRTKWFVENLWDALQIGRDGYIEIVAHNADHDISILKDLFHSNGYPFFVDDEEKEFKNGEGKTPLFNHNIHDTRQIGQAFRVQRQSENLYSQSRLCDVATYLSIPIPTDRLHSSRADCYLTARCFIKWQQMLRCMEYSEIAKESVAKNEDYTDARPDDYDAAPAGSKKINKRKTK